MTHAEIDAMPAGPEIDALACAAVKWGKCPHRNSLGNWTYGFRPISTDHATALDALAAVYTGTLTHDAHGWHVKIGDNKTCREYWASGDTAALAIARALAKMEAS